MNTLVKKLKETLNKKQGKLFVQQIDSFDKTFRELDKKTLEILYNYSLSEGNTVYEDICYFLEKHKDQKFLNFSSDPVYERIFHTSQRVRREIHRFKGFLRFKEVKGGYLYASFKPEFNIILPLSRHFAYRMMKEKIIIHDTKRDLAVFCYENRVYPAQIESFIPDDTALEKIISSLWIEYFEKVAIKERFNKKLQRQKVPLKYRNSISEFRREHV